MHTYEPPDLTTLSGNDLAGKKAAAAVRRGVGRAVVAVAAVAEVSGEVVIAAVTSAGAVGAVVAVAAVTLTVAVGAVAVAAVIIAVAAVKPYACQPCEGLHKLCLKSAEGRVVGMSERSQVWDVQGSSAPGVPLHEREEPGEGGAGLHAG